MVDLWDLLNPTDCFDAESRFGNEEEDSDINEGKVTDVVKKKLIGGRDSTTIP